MILMKSCQDKKANIDKQAKEKADRVNLDEITSESVGIDTGFEDTCKNKGIRYKGKLGGEYHYLIVQILIVTLVMKRKEILLMMMKW